MCDIQLASCPLSAMLIHGCESQRVHICSTSHVSVIDHTVQVRAVQSTRSPGHSLVCHCVVSGDATLALPFAFPNYISSFGMWSPNECRAWNAAWNGEDGTHRPFHAGEPRLRRILCVHLSIFVSASRFGWNDRDSCLPPFSFSGR